MGRVRRLASRYGWWIALSFAVAIVAGVALGSVLLLAAYAVINTVGTTLYLSAVDGRTPPGRRRWRAFVPLTILQVPVGLLGVLMSPGGTSPTDGLVGDPDSRSRFAFSRMWRGTGRGAP